MLIAQVFGKALGQDQRRAQVRLQVRVPGPAIRGRQIVVLEDRGVIDQHAERPNKLRRAGDQRLGFAFLRKVGLQQVRLAAGGLDLLYQRGRRVAGSVVVNRHAVAIGGQRLGHGAADPPGAAGDQ